MDGSLEIFEGEVPFPALRDDEAERSEFPGEAEFEQVGPVFWKETSEGGEDEDIFAVSDGVGARGEVVHLVANDRWGFAVFGRDRGGEGGLMEVAASTSGFRGGRSGGRFGTIAGEEKHDEADSHNEGKNERYRIGAAKGTEGHDGWIVVRRWADEGERGGRKKGGTKKEN